MAHRLIKKIIKGCAGCVFRLLPAKCVSTIVRMIPQFGKAVPPGKKIIFYGYRDAFRLDLDSQYTIDRAMLGYGYETGLCDLIAESVQPGDICVDAGANIGAVAFVMAKIAGKVYAFEPGPPTHARLIRNIALNPECEQVIVPVAAGLGEKEGQLLWRGDWFGGGNGGFLPGDKALSGDGDRVPITTLDNFVQSKALDRLDFIKIDVEGMEIEVLKGGRNTIAKCRPKIVLETLTDFSEIRGRDLLAEIKAFFDELDYELYRVGDNKRIETVGDFGMNTLALPAGGTEDGDVSHREHRDTQSEE